MQRTTFRRPSHARDPGRRGPADPADSNAILARFTEMLMNDFRAGQPGRSGPETLFPAADDSFGFPGHVHRTAFSVPGFSGGTTSFTIASTSRPAPAAGGLPAGHGDFDAYAPPPPLHRPSSSGLVLVSLGRGTNHNHPPRVFSGIMGMVPPPPARDANRPVGDDAGALPAGFPATLHQILTQLLNPAHALHGDAVFSQEEMDRIITALMEANPQSNAAPPASQVAIDGLERKNVDDKILGTEGKAECTICITEVHRGDEVVVLPCKHWFHDECVVMWLKEHNTCPVCRAPIEAGSGGQPSPTRRPSRPAGAPSPRPGGSSTTRSLRDPPESDDRSRTFRFGVPASPGSLPSPRGTAARDRDSRRNSLSPVSPRPPVVPEQSSSWLRRRTPSPHSRRSSSRGQDREQRRNSQSGHGIFNFLRDPFHRNSPHGPNNNDRRRS